MCFIKDCLSCGLGCFALGKLCCRFRDLAADEKLCGHGLAWIVGVALSSSLSSRLTSKLAGSSSLKSKHRPTGNSLSDYLRKAGVDHKLVMVTSLQVRKRLRSTLALGILRWKAQGLLHYEIGRKNLGRPWFRKVANH